MDNFERQAMRRQTQVVRQLNKQKIWERKQQELARLDNEHIHLTSESTLNHPVGACYRQRVTTEKVKYLLLNHLDTIIRGGNVCKMQVEKLGFGVCDISFQDPVDTGGVWT